MLAAVSHALVAAAARPHFMECLQQKQTLDRTRFVLVFVEAERLVGSLKGFRRVATRFEKRAVHLVAMVTLPAVLLGLCPLPTSLRSFVDEALCPTRRHSQPCSITVFHYG